MALFSKNPDTQILDDIREQHGPVAGALAEAAVIAAGVTTLKRRAADGDARAQELLAEAAQLGIRT